MTFDNNNHASYLIKRSLNRDHHARTGSFTSLISQIEILNGIFFGAVEVYPFRFQ